MNAKYFLDTNIFVYSFDARHAVKQRKAQKLIDDALSRQAGLISYQVIQEFLNVALRKFDKPLTPAEAKEYMDDVLYPLCEVLPSRDLYSHALHLQKETGFGFYDSVIVASAAQARCARLYTEDLQHGRRIADLLIQNPFL